MALIVVLIILALCFAAITIYIRRNELKPHVMAYLQDMSSESFARLMRMLFYIRLCKFLFKELSGPSEAENNVMQKLVKLSLAIVSEMTKLKTPAPIGADRLLERAKEFERQMQELITENDGDMVTTLIKRVESASLVCTIPEIGFVSCRIKYMLMDIRCAITFVCESGTDDIDGIGFTFLPCDDINIVCDGHANRFAVHGQGVASLVFSNQSCNTAPAS